MTAFVLGEEKLKRTGTKKDLIHKNLNIKMCVLVWCIKNFDQLIKGVIQ